MLPAACHKPAAGMEQVYDQVVGPEAWAVVEGLLLEWQADRAAPGRQVTWQEVHAAAEGAGKLCCWVLDERPQLHALVPPVLDR